MNTGICTATGYDLNCLAKYLAQGFFYYLLHTQRIMLVLPAVVVGAFVGDFKEVAHQVAGSKQRKMVKKI